MKQKEIDAIQEMYARHNYRCFVCDDICTQRAHALGDTIPNRSKYGSEIVDSQKNWFPACNLDHNGLIDLGKNDILMSIVAGLIKSVSSESRQEIEDIVRGNIERKRGK